MSTLPRIQAGFAATILRDDVTGVVPAIEADGLVPSPDPDLPEPLLSSLTEVLASTYSVVCRLVDRHFFGFVADAYV